MWIESMNSFEIQCITEGLQIDKAGLRTKIQSQMDKTNDFFSESWHDPGLQGSTKQFLCTPLDKMVLVRNQAHTSWARHRIWLSQHGQATEFRIS